MRLEELNFDRPESLVAKFPLDANGGKRDSVRLMVSTPEGHHHTGFSNIANFFEADDLLVVNDSATLPASLPARGRLGEFVLNLSR